MVNIVKQPKYTTEVITKDGEIKLLLEINLNINNNQVSVKPAGNLQEEEDEKINWVIPKFELDDKIKFGKKVGD